MIELKPLVDDNDDGDGDDDDDGRRRTYLGNNISTIPDTTYILYIYIYIHYMSLLGRYVRLGPSTVCTHTYRAKKRLERERTIERERERKNVRYKTVELRCRDSHTGFSRPSFSR